jgi:hypothetical protein
VGSALGPSSMDGHTPSIVADELEPVLVTHVDGYAGHTRPSRARIKTIVPSHDAVARIL